MRFAKSEQQTNGFRPTTELLRRTDDSNDKLIAYHLDGEPTGEALEVEKGILQEYKANEKSGTDLTGDSFSSVEINNDENAKELFEFMATLLHG